MKFTIITKRGGIISDINCIYSDGNKMLAGIYSNEFHLENGAEIYELLNNEELDEVLIYIRSQIYFGNLNNKNDVLIDLYSFNKSKNKKTKVGKTLKNLDEFKCLLTYFEEVLKKGWKLLYLNSDNEEMEIEYESDSEKFILTNIKNGTMNIISEFNLEELICLVNEIKYSKSINVQSLEYRIKKEISFKDIDDFCKSCI